MSGKGWSRSRGPALFFESSKYTLDRSPFLSTSPAADLLLTLHSSLKTGILLRHLLTPRQKQKQHRMAKLSSHAIAEEDTPPPPSVPSAAAAASSAASSSDPVAPLSEIWSQVELEQWKMDHHQEEEGYHEEAARLAYASGPTPLASKFNPTPGKKAAKGAFAGGPRGPLVPLSPPSTTPPQVETLSARGATKNHYPYVEFGCSRYISVDRADLKNDSEHLRRSLAV